MRRYVDVVAGAGALAWAVVAQTSGEFGLQLDELVSVEAAAAFSLMAFGRWMAEVKRERS